jgi:ATP-dependent helicase/nuclease subunit A
MVAARECVGDDRRPARFGDVMILVRRRGALFHEIIRALKREGAPVAGADRLRLSEHGVYQDLMALGRFVRFPSDDLALAGLLRSPLSDCSEADLYDLAQGRGRVPLWPTLERRGGERPPWEAARRLLGWAIAEAGRRAPFDFYCRLLNRLDAGGRSMRQRILTRMSAEGEPALDAFLAQVLAAERDGVRDLESLLAWMEASDLEIKREQAGPDAGEAGEVRVMTVHGAKGLEAPIVILPDTSTRASPQEGPLLDTGDGGFLWAPRQADDCPASAAAREARAMAVERESARLLYVALTRARDRLIIAGVKSRDFERSWYDFVEGAFGRIGSHAIELADSDVGRRFGPDPRAAPVRPTPAAAMAPAPAWLRLAAPREAAIAALASPSKLGEDEPGVAPSPLARAAGLGRYRRGDLIHRLLQVLPDLPADAHAEGARRLLAREPGLSETQREEMTAAALAVLNDARFAAVFGPHSRAEVPLAGSARRLPTGLAVSGRVDRLVVEPGRVLVVDFKTNRPPPRRVEDVAEAYILQMAVYAALLEDLYPGRVVEAALLWTDGPDLMPVPAAMMEAALRRLQAESQNLQAVRS